MPGPLTLDPEGRTCSASTGSRTRRRSSVDGRSSAWCGSWPTGATTQAWGTDGVVWHEVGEIFEGFDIDFDARGGLLFSGYRTIRGESMAGVVRFDGEDGSIDEDFGADGVAWVPAYNTHIPVADIGPDGRITVATETMLTSRAHPDVTVARFEPDGRLDRHVRPRRPDARQSRRDGWNSPSTWPCSPTARPWSAPPPGRLDQSRLRGLSPAPRRPPRPGLRPQRRDPLLWHPPRPDLRPPGRLLDDQRHQIRCAGLLPLAGRPRDGCGPAGRSERAVRHAPGPDPTPTPGPSPTATPTRRRRPRSHRPRRLRRRRLQA